MQEDRAPRRGIFERLFAGSPRAPREDRVREYIIHRTRHGARLDDVLREDYVLSNCSKDELDEIVRDPRLIREEREELQRLFTDGRLDPALALRRR